MTLLSSKNWDYQKANEELLDARHGSRGRVIVVLPGSLGYSRLQSTLWPWQYLQSSAYKLNDLLSLLCLYNINWQCKSWLLTFFNKTMRIRFFFLHRYWQHLLSAVRRAKFMRHMLLQNSWALEWTFKNTYLWQNISPLLPGHAGRGVELVGLDGHNVVVVAQVPGGCGHAKVIPRWQSHSLCVKQMIISNVTQFCYNKFKDLCQLKKFAHLLRHKEPRRAC